VQADAAILVVAAPPKEFDDGFGGASASVGGASGSSGAGAGAGAGATRASSTLSSDGDDVTVQGFGQTKEHAILVRGLGIKQLIVCVNKMDMVRGADGRAWCGWGEVVVVCVEKGGGGLSGA
jgi:hypothetical protein